MFRLIQYKFIDGKLMVICMKKVVLWSYYFEINVLCQWSELTYMLILQNLIVKLRRDKTEMWRRYPPQKQREDREREVEPDDGGRYPVCCRSAPCVGAGSLGAHVRSPSSFLIGALGPKVEEQKASPCILSGGKARLRLPRWSSRRGSSDRGG